MNQITKPSILLFIILISAAAVAAQSTAFTYQGKLLDGGAPANGTYEMQFTLWNSAANGTQIGGVVGNSNVTVTQGIFTVPIDFGFIALAIDLQGLKYLEISVRSNSADPFTILTPRQLVTSAPYATIASAAQSASIATTATNAGNADNLGGVPASSYLQANGNGSGLSNLNASSLTSGIIPSGRYGIDVASTEHGNEFYGENIFTENTSIFSIDTGGIVLNDWGYIEHMRMENLAADPEPPSAENPGTIYFNTAEKAVKVSDGTAWTNIAGPNLGRVKAIVLIDGNGLIARCENVVLNTSTPPCGMSNHIWGLGDYEIDFGFSVANRFILGSTGGLGGYSVTNAFQPNHLLVQTYDDNGQTQGRNVTIFVY